MRFEHAQCYAIGKRALCATKTCIKINGSGPDFF